MAFTSTKDSSPVDVGKVTLTTQHGDARHGPDGGGGDGGARCDAGPLPGHYQLPDRGDRQVTVSWDGPAGKGSTKFTVPVR